MVFLWGDYTHNFFPCVVDEEMITGEIIRFKSRCGLVRPSFESFAADTFIVETAEGDDGNIQRRLARFEAIRFHGFKVRAQAGEENLQRLRVIQNLGRDAVELFQRVQKLAVRQGVNRRIEVRELRRSAGGDEKPGWARQTSPESTRQFEGDQPSHTVTEQREGFIQQRLDFTKDVFNQNIQSFYRWFVESRPSARVVGDLCFDVSRHPFDERGGVSSSVWKDEQPRLSRRFGLRTDKPLCWRHGVLDSFSRNPRGMK